MAETYTRANAVWANGSAGATEIDADAMNLIESGIDRIYKLPNAKGDLIVATAADTLERLAVGSDDTVPVAASGQATGVIWQQVGNAQVASGAAIAYSKLNLATSIVNADVSGSAAIAQTKLSFTAPATYTPALTGASSNPTMGSGAVQEGRWMQLGKLVFVRVHITFGTSPTNPGGLWQVDLPTSAQGTFRITGSGFVYDDSASQTYVVSARTNATTSLMNLFYHGGDRFSGTTPITVAVNDTIHLDLLYEAA